MESEKRIYGSHIDEVLLMKAGANQYYLGLLVQLVCVASKRRDACHGLFRSIIMQLAKCFAVWAFVVFPLSLADGLEQPPNAPLNSRDPNMLFPCWAQSWRDGNWRPLASKVDTRYVLESYTPEGKLLMMSVCRSCTSIRIIDPAANSERVLQSLRARLQNCSHNWRPSYHHWSRDPVEVGDILIIIYKQQMYALVLEHISPGAFIDKISYRIAEVGQDGTLPTVVNLEQLAWQSREAEEKLPIADRQLRFVISTHRLKSGDPKYTMSIWYDNRFGCMGGQMGRVHEAPFHIAIVHKGDLKDSRIADLTQFRFKTWEDGLGNRCDEQASEQTPAPQELVLLDLHNAPVRAVAVAPDGSYIVTTGDDGRVVIQHLDEAITKVVGPFQYARLETLALSADGTLVLAGGELNDFGSILKVHVADGKYEQIGIDSTGTMIGLWYCEDEDHIAYITVNRLAFFDLKACELISSHNIFGGFPLGNAGSADGRFFAAISQNVVDNMSAEPCKLTIFDESGAETLSYRFESCRYACRSHVIFLGSDCLALCLPTGEIWQWKWLPKGRKWTVDKKVQIPRGEFSAIASCLDGRAVCLAEKSRVVVVDTSTPQILTEKVFQIGEPRSGVWAKPITAIREIPGRQTLVITFWDGRVALWRLPDEVTGSRASEP